MTKNSLMNTLPPNRIQSALLAFIMFFTVSGCEKVQIGEPFNCKVGTKYLLENNITFSIDSITDYRCPKDVMCIWSGDVDLFFDISIKRVPLDTMVQLYRNNPIDIGNYNWKVLEVNPWLNSGQAIDQKDYRIKLLIHKN